jgi:hypothetical protein
VAKIPSITPEEARYVSDDVFMNQHPELAMSLFNKLKGNREYVIYPRHASWVPNLEEISVQREAIWRAVATGKIHVEGGS